MFSKITSALRCVVAVLVGVPMTMVIYVLVALGIVAVAVMALASAAGGVVTMLSLAVRHPVLITLIVAAILIVAARIRKSARYIGGSSACEYVLMAVQTLRADNGNLPAATTLMSWLQALREGSWKPVYSESSNSFETAVLDKSGRSGYDDALVTMQRYLSHRCRQGREAEALADLATFVRHLHGSREETIKEWAVACPTLVPVLPAHIETNHGSFFVDSFIQAVLDERLYHWIESLGDEDATADTEDAKVVSRSQLSLF